MVTNSFDIAPLKTPQLDILIPYMTIKPHTHRNVTFMVSDKLHLRRRDHLLIIQSTISLYHCFK